MKSNAQNTNDKVLVLIFAIVFVMLLLAAYVVATQPNLEYWSLFLCGLAALVFIDLRWLKKASADNQVQS